MQVQTYNVEMTDDLSAAFFGSSSEPREGAQANRFASGDSSLFQERSLLDYAGLAARLATSEGWVRRNARRTYTRDPIPSVRLGKNVRFDWAQVEQWLKRRMK